jgi:hypothetical protein
MKVLRRLGMNLLTPILLSSAVVLLAQTGQKPAPRFTLTISEYRKERAPGTYRIRLMETNISNEDLRVGPCAVERGMYNLSVVYDGVLMEERDVPARNLMEERERHTPCTSGSGYSPLKPRQSYVSFALGLSWRYDMTNPGTYEITVSRETDPDHPEKSVTVKSNTLIIVVPEPGAAALQ